MALAWAGNVKALKDTPEKYLRTGVEWATVTQD
jgi:hypothetical protein